MNPDLLNQLVEEGFSVVPGFLSPAEVQRLLAGLKPVTKLDNGRRRGGSRNLLRFDNIRDLADSESIRGLVTSVLGGDAFPVRAILFDKVPEANWKVPWHQDLSIAVCEGSTSKVLGRGLLRLASFMFNRQPAC